MMTGFLFLLFATLVLKSECQNVGVDSDVINSIVTQAKATVNSEYQHAREDTLGRVAKFPGVLSNSLQLMKQPRGSTREAVRCGDAMYASLTLIQNKTVTPLSDDNMRLIGKLTGCSDRARPPSCTAPPNAGPFRTANAVCNNRKKPFLGSSNVPFARWLPAEYQDVVSRPRGWRRRRRPFRSVIPLVRRVSNIVVRAANRDLESDSLYTHLLTIFAQWTDHDLTFTPISPVIRSFEGGVECETTCNRTEPCFPIRIPRRDPRFGRNSGECMPFVRSSAACGAGDNVTALSVRQQINGITAYIDVGQVYGSEAAQARELRDLTSDKGLLRVNTRFKDNGRELLPFSTMATNMCATKRPITGSTDCEEVPCFVAGDERANENIGLTAIHTVMLREHNRLARALANLNPQWKGERIYQETRKILGGYLQVITFRDYLPHIFGSVSTYPGYDENVDPSISNVFATAAYRFAHLNIQPRMFRLDEQYREHAEFPSPLLHRTFFTPWRLVFEGGVDPIMRGLMGHPAKLGTQDNMMHRELRDRLFHFTEHVALDLAALNMQRGRDHGLPGYNKWRKFCGLSQPQNVTELNAVLNNWNLTMWLVSLYGHPDDIDVWLGGVAEPFVPGGRTGPLFACLINAQFQRIRQGDRHWWENPGVFTTQQKESLKNTDLARIICDNTGITEVPRKPFLNQPAGFTNCADIPAFNLSPWKE